MTGMRLDGQSYGDVELMLVVDVDTSLKVENSRSVHGVQHLAWYCVGDVLERDVSVATLER